MYIVIGILIFAILVLALNNVGIHYKWKHKYEALETGANEQQESYEQEYLQFDETTEGLRTIVKTNVEHMNSREEYIHKLEDIVERHGRNCLPNLANMQDIHG